MQLDYQNKQQKMSSIFRQGNFVETGFWINENMAIKMWIHCRRYFLLVKLKKKKKSKNTPNISFY